MNQVRCTFEILIKTSFYSHVWRNSTSRTQTQCGLKHWNQPLQTPHSQHVAFPQLHPTILGLHNSSRISSIQSSPRPHSSVGRGPPVNKRSTVEGCSSTKCFSTCGWVKAHTRPYTSPFHHPLWPFLERILMVSPSCSDSSERSLAEKLYLALATLTHFTLPPVRPHENQQ